MDLSFYPLTLEAIDLAAAESLCLFIGADERPLTGLAGLCDWRLSGRLSRLLRGNLLTGEAGEAVLTPPGARLGFRKLFLFGVGSSGQSEESLVLRVGEALRKLAQAGVQEAAMQLPARLSPELGIRTLIDELQGPARAMVFGPDPQRLVSALSQAASRGTAQLERRVVKVPAPPPPAPVPVRAPPPVAVKPALPRQAPPPQSLPKASPLAFAPQTDLPTPMVPPQPIPTASPLAFAPPPEPIAPAVPSEPPPPPVPIARTEPPPGPVTQPEPRPAPVAAAPLQPPVAEGDRKPDPGPPQRYVPPPPKPHIFQQGRRRKKH